MDRVEGLVRQDRVEGDVRGDPDAHEIGLFWLQNHHVVLRSAPAAPFLLHWLDVCLALIGSEIPSLAHRLGVLGAVVLLMQGGVSLHLADQRLQVSKLIVLVGELGESLRVLFEEHSRFERFG